MENFQEFPTFPPRYSVGRKSVVLFFQKTSCQFLYRIRDDHSSLHLFAAAHLLTFPPASSSPLPAVFPHDSVRCLPIPMLGEGAAPCASRIPCPVSNPPTHLANDYAARPILFTRPEKTQSTASRDQISSVALKRGAFYSCSIRCGPSPVNGQGRKPKHKRHLQSSGRQVRPQ